MADTVARRLVFSVWADASKRQPFDRLTAAAALGEIAEEELVLEHGSESLTAVEVVQAGSDKAPTCLRVLALRDFENRPSVWGPGAGATPVTINNDQYMADITHVAIWDDNIAAYDVYSSAPGLGRLSSYLRDQIDEKVTFRALYQPNLAERLRDLRGVRRIEYALHTPHKIQMASEAGLIGSLLPEAFGPSAPSIRVSLGMGRSGPRSATLGEDVSEPVLQIADKAEQFFDSLVIAGKSKSQTTEAGNPKTVRINLLSERVQVETSIDRAVDGGNVPNEDAVYRALRSARRAMNDVLNRAVEARLDVQQALLDGDG